MLQTVLTEIEAIINDRPLTYISSRIDDEELLTPAHLLYGRRISTTPYPASDLDMNTHSRRNDICKRAQTQKLFLEHFWNRWKMEYLTSIRELHRVTGDNKRTISVGDIVHIQEDKPRNGWKLSIVEELITGNDGHVRAAVVRTNTGRTSRPIIKLYPIELKCETETTGETKDDEDKSTGDVVTRTVTQREAARHAKENIHRWTHGLLT